MSRLIVSPTARDAVLFVAAAQHPGARTGMSHIRVAENRATIHEILVVDDEQAVRDHWRCILEHASFHVRVAGDGEEALQEVRRQLPDLIILDIMMPRLDGHEVCRRLKASQQTESIPIIMVTARGDYEGKIECLRSGANDYLVKESAGNNGAGAAGSQLGEELVERVRNVLRLRVDNRDGNPLTGLPGNARIERELTVRLQAGRPLAFLFIDIDHFKAYNDYYGYRRGDEAIRRTADLIGATVWKHGGADDFIGHVGGDDFVVMTTPAHADAIAGELVAGFDHVLRELFDPDVYAAGSFSVEGRTGKVERFQLMSLTIAVVTSEHEALEHPAQVNDRAMELKHFGKKQPGSFIARERRSGT
jgi:PleD family two-component response regulator